jgi:hypothetical protein
MILSFLHALRAASPDQLRRVLHAAADTLATAPKPDWTKIERLVRERIGLAEALKIRGSTGSGSDGTVVPGLSMLPARSPNGFRRMDRHAEAWDTAWSGLYGGPTAEGIADPLPRWWTVGGEVR